MLNNSSKLTLCTLLFYLGLSVLLFSFLSTISLEEVTTIDKEELTLATSLCESHSGVAELRILLIDSELQVTCTDKTTKTFDLD